MHQEGDEEGVSMEVDPEEEAGHGRGREGRADVDPDDAPT